MVEATHRRLLTAAAVLGWFIAVGAGMTALARYKSTPAPQRDSPERWPVATQLHRQTGRYALLVFLHPKCPCSRATVSELSRLLDRTAGALDAQAIFHLPEGTERDFVETDLWRRVKELPGLAPLIDRGGREARRFGAVTSGYTLLYSPDGALLFAGGITVARGHEGTSPGVERILSLLEHPHAERTGAPVFGCALNDAVSAVPPQRTE